MLIINLFSEILRKRGIKTVMGKYNDDGMNSKKYLQNICAGLYEKKKFEFHFKKKIVNYCLKILKNIIFLLKN